MVNSDLQKCQMNWIAGVKTFGAFEESDGFRVRKGSQQMLDATIEVLGMSEYDDAERGYVVRIKTRENSL